MTASYNVEIRHQGTTSTITVAEDQPILNVALDAGLDIASSGVCTTCAGKIISSDGDRAVDHRDSMGLGPELQADGYVLLCVATPCSNLVIETGCEDEVYNRQFGQN